MSKKENTAAIILGIALFAAAAVISISLIVSILDFSSTYNKFSLSLFGNMLFSMYGICSFLIPVFIFVCACFCIDEKWNIQKLICLLISIIPFFTLVLAEKISRKIAATDYTVVAWVKIITIIVIAFLLVSVEYLLSLVLGTRFIAYLKAKRNNDVIKEEESESDDDLEDNKIVQEEEELTSEGCELENDKILEENKENLIKDSKESDEIKEETEETLSEHLNQALTEDNEKDNVMPLEEDAQFIGLSKGKKVTYKADRWHTDRKDKKSEKSLNQSSEKKAGKDELFKNLTNLQKEDFEDEEYTEKKDDVELKNEIDNSEINTEENKILPLEVTENTESEEKNVYVQDDDKTILGNDNDPWHVVDSEPHGRVIYLGKKVKKSVAENTAEQIKENDKEQETSVDEEENIIDEFEQNNIQEYENTVENNDVELEEKSDSEENVENLKKNTSEVLEDNDSLSLENENNDVEDENIQIENDVFSEKKIENIKENLENNIEEESEEEIAEDSIDESVRIQNENFEELFRAPETAGENADDDFIDIDSSLDFEDESDETEDDNLISSSIDDLDEESQIDENIQDDEEKEETKIENNKNETEEEESHSMLSALDSVFAKMDEDAKQAVEKTEIKKEDKSQKEVKNITSDRAVITDEKGNTASVPVVPSKKRRGSYSIPTDLLTAYEQNPYWIIDDETKLAAQSLKETLNEFKIEAEVTGIIKGPVVTMFEILPAPGVKLSKIVALQDNIALRLAASSVRIVAPIPGKRAVGIEIPNKERAIVSFRECIEQNRPEWKKMGVPVILGKDIQGQTQIIDLVKTPHMLIAGSTGAGKSVCVNSMILSILYKRSPNDVKLILIDPKIVELKLYNDIPHLLTPVITEPKKAMQSLQYCLCEMERRYAILDQMSCRDISSYNKKIADQHIATEKLPYIIVVIDEFADLMATTGKQLEGVLARLAAMSRAVGIHLVLATQRPSIDVITGLIKANIPSRIAFMVASKTDSRIIIDQVGAEKLLGKGDMLYASATDPFPVRIQGTFISDQEVEDVVSCVKEWGEPEYIDDEIFVDDEDDGEDGSQMSLFSDGAEDPLYEKALDIVVQAGKASASYIQRRLKIGYNRAARLVEEMEERGIVGPANGSKPREIIHLP